ncbi:MAG TPA: pyridoxal phosphate-dependent aminotransferase family protein [Methylomirabilota bacterium]|nr:pyridoxal phosphate-dependent aminotransferase family protein [Methylomirabilota bacterium]
MLGPSLQPGRGVEIIHEGRKLISFSGCDYFRLSSHPSVIEAANRAIQEHGWNVSASRATTGNHPLYAQLESELEIFFGAPALLASSGYISNIVVAQGLANKADRVFLDEKAHPSLQDAARFWGTAVRRFKHRDAESLKGALENAGKAIVLTDGVFAHDGSVAPLKAYHDLLPPRSWLIADDAHGAGVIGPAGQGTVALHGLRAPNVVQTITLSKAFGAFGGAVIASRSLLDQIVDRSGAFIGGTPIPLPSAAAALQALRLLRSDTSFIERLRANTAVIKQAARGSGVRLPDSEAPVVSVAFSDPAEAEALRTRLLAAGIYPPFLKYPGGPAAGFFRFVISSEHAPEHLERLLRACRWAR